MTGLMTGCRAASKSLSRSHLEAANGATSRARGLRPRSNHAPSELMPWDANTHGAAPSYSRAGNCPRRLGRRRRKNESLAREKGRSSGSFKVEDTGHEPVTSTLPVYSGVFSVVSPWDINPHGDWVLAELGFHRITPVVGLQLSDLPRDQVQATHRRTQRLLIGTRAVRAWVSGHSERPLDVSEVPWCTSDGGIVENHGCPAPGTLAIVDLDVTTEWGKLRWSCVRSRNGFSDRGTSPDGAGCRLSGGSGVDMAEKPQRHGPQEANAANDAHCEYCAVYYADAATPVQGAQENHSAREAAGSDEDIEDGFTHCEYCGAEYPVPRSRSKADPR